jgi:hypothetical protein
MDQSRILRTFTDTATQLSNYYKETRTSIGNQKSEAAKSIQHDIERLIMEVELEGRQPTVEDLERFVTDKLAESEAQLRRLEQFK